LDQLAAQAEISKSYLWELENRDAANPTMDKLARIAAPLGVTAEYLLDSGNADPTEDVVDRAFFRKYQEQSPETKRKIQDILKIIQSTEGKKG
jgi:transcriptional regulator with XRE-family HTH domain